MAETPSRNLRIPDALWRAAKERAEAEHTTITALVIRALQREVKRR